jgi:nucleotide-binding universal stress UspA family protein
MERILFGIDGSRPSLKTVDFAVDLAAKYNAELILLTVVPGFSPEADPAVEDYARVEQVPATELVLAAADGLLDDARRRAHAKGATRISSSSVCSTAPIRCCTCGKPGGVR